MPTHPDDSVFSLRIPAAENLRLKRLARYRRVSKNGLIVQAIRDLLAKPEGR